MSLIISLHLYSVPVVAIIKADGRDHTWWLYVQFLRWQNQIALMAMACDKMVWRYGDCNMADG